MGSMYILVTPVILLIIQHNIFVMGDSIILDPSLPTYPLNSGNRPVRQFIENAQFPVQNRNIMGIPRQPILHNNIMESQSVLDRPGEESRSSNVSFTELVNAFNELAEHEEKEDHARSTAREYEYTPYAYRPQSYGYSSRPSYQQWGPSYSSYHEPAYSPPSPPLPSAPAHHSLSKISLLKPTLDLVKPVTTKVASKVSGLIGLVLALLTGSSPDNVELKGFKDIIINGIVKPLLIAKGGIKTLISKLSIPVISLLLINLEVLITVWWLWEDCPEPVHTPPPYTYPKPTYNYNMYR